MSEANKFIPNKARFKYKGQHYTLLLAKNEFMFKPATQTAGNSISLTDGYIAVDGVEIKKANLSLPVANYRENIQVITILAQNCSYEEVTLEGEDTAGLPLLFIAKGVIRKTDFQLDLGSSGGASNTVEFDCASCNFVS